MPDYRRRFVPGGTYFFTLVTAGRAPILDLPAARAILRGVIGECRTRWPFELDAIVLLPDHLHAICTLPPGDDAYPRRLGWLKKEFTSRWLAAGGSEKRISQAKQHARRRGVWQRKYWEHTCEDEEDLCHHLDYLHYNPVKHGMVDCPHQWKYSSFHRFVAHGLYPRDWCCDERISEARQKAFATIGLAAGE